mgnify:CR=1 FL=1
MPIRPEGSSTSKPTAGPTIQLASGENMELSWQERSLCAQTDPEAFFPEKGGSTRDAKRICSGCEVKAQCLDYALANDERFGIWGGLSEREDRKSVV